MPNPKGSCPVCDASVKPNSVEESEIVSCVDCKSRLVVEKIKNNELTLNTAPEIEEDWGE